jgi:hypothetical protein
VKHIQTTFSDHEALVLSIQELRDNRGRRRKARQFRYKQMWQRHDGYVDFVNQAWDLGIGEGSLLTIVESLSDLQSSL